MKSKATLFGLILWALFFANAHATPEKLENFCPAQSHRQTFYDIGAILPCTLIQSGVNAVGDLQMQTLLHEFLQVRISLFSLGFPAGSDGERAGMVNFPSNKTIIVSPLAFQSAAAEVQPVWALHENIEAIGYNDENYPLSIGIWWLTQISPTEKDAFLSPAVLQVFRRLKEVHRDRVYVLADGGGATGTGGGGDPYAIQAKMELMKSAKVFWTQVHQANPSSSLDLGELYRLVLTCQLETDYTIDGKVTPAFERDFRGRLKIRIPFQMILVPQAKAAGVKLILSTLAESNP